MALISCTRFRCRSSTHSVVRNVSTIWRGLLEVGLPRAERQHVGVVVLAAVPGQRDVVTGRRAHAVHLVGGHGRADAGAVDHDAAVALPAGHQPRHRVGNARIIDGILAVGAAILDQTALVAQQAEKLILQLEPAMVRADGNLKVLHGSNLRVPWRRAAGKGQARVGFCNCFTRRLYQPKIGGQAPTWQGRFAERCVFM